MRRLNQHFLTSPVKPNQISDRDWQTARLDDIPSLESRSELDCEAARRRPRGSYAKCLGSALAERDVVAGCLGLKR